MAKKEAQTDIWVHELLKSAQVTLSYQGSDISELDKALKTASKAGTGKVGKPEFIGVVKDFVLVIENKAETSQHAARDRMVTCWRILQANKLMPSMDHCIMPSISSSIQVIGRSSLSVFREMRSAI